MTPPEDLLLSADAGRLVWLGGLGVRFVLDGQRTGGGFALVEHPLKPRALGSPVHTHTREDEYSYVLDGTVGVQIGNTEMLATAGMLVVKPRGLPHAFWNAGDAPARLLEIISPAGFETYFADMADLFASGVPDPTRGETIRQRYGLELDLASIPSLAARHRLVLPG
jgi:quercetin dioxygenase-like cupin family protein